MFTTHTLLLFLHILLFAYWLGSDIGVFYGMRFVLDPARSLEARKTAMAIVHWIDLLPRMCLVLMIPSGISLAVGEGLLDLSPAGGHAVLIGAWVGGLSWLAMVIRLYGGVKDWTVRVDWVVRIAVAAGSVVMGAASLAGFGPVVAGIGWLALKMMLFGGAIICGIGLRLLGRPFGRALTAIFDGHSTPEIEAELETAMRHSKRVVLLLWAFVAATAYVGLAKSF